MPFQDSARSLKAKLHISHLETTQVIGLVIALVIVVLFAGKLLIGSMSVSQSEIVVEKASDSSADLDSSDAAAEKTITVYVVGSVSNPGVFEVAEGSRVNDAVVAAGGLTDDADAQAINLARVISDGEEILVPSVNDSESNDENSASSQAASASGSSTGLVNINTATSEELETLSGIGPSTAAKIIADREQNGVFKTKEDLKRVSGIGDKKYAAIENAITVG